MCEQDKAVAVTREFDDNTIKVLVRFDTVSEAVEYLSTDNPEIDQDALVAGHYGIDAPEEMLNPVTELKHEVTHPVGSGMSGKSIAIAQSRDEMALAYSVKLIDVFGNAILNRVLEKPLEQWEPTLARASYRLADLMIAEALKPNRVDQEQ